MSIISNSSIEKIKPKKNFSSQFSAAPQRTKFNPHSSPNPSPSPQRRDPNIFQTNRNSKCRLSSSKHDLDNSWENIHGSKSPKNMRHLLNNCKKRFEDKSFRKEDDSKRPLSRPSDFDSRGRQLNDKDAHELAKILHNHLNRQQTGKESQPSSIGINETRFEQPSWDRHLNGSDQFGLNVSHQQLLKDLSNSKVDMRSDNYGDMRG